MDKIMCCNCGSRFSGEGGLAKVLVTAQAGGVETYEPYNPVVPLKESQEVIDGCPVCLTDAYLMDL